LRGGAVEDWVGAFGIVIAIITVLNNIDAFQVHPAPGAIVPPHLQWLYGNQKPGYSSPSLHMDAIAKNTGYKRKNVQNCKNHLFYDIHRLDRYESLGEPVEIKRFDANENQARAPKLQENPVDRNNLGQGSCRSSKHPSRDKIANSLSPEYSKFQNKYYSKSLPKRFDTNQCSVRKFKELAKDPRVNGVKYDRVSIDEARAIVQAKLENLVIEPTRPDMLTARHVDLDYEVLGLAPFTHFDVKNPVGSEVLIKQGQTISLEDMAYKIGQNIVDQKHRFVGLENGPASSENVGHIVDLCYLPGNEKAIVRQTILQGARDKGRIFLNDK
jgi:hypothetical protein